MFPESFFFFLLFILVSVIDIKDFLAYLVSLGCLLIMMFANNDELWLVAHT
jgi:hypothetical protein